MPAPAAATLSQWRVPEFDLTTAQMLATEHSLHPVVARILSARGWAPGDDRLGLFLNPSLKDLRPPDDLSGMDSVVERILRARRDGEHVCVYGDYDVDGVSSTAIMVSVLRFLGMTPSYIIPNRFSDGYGMTVERVDEIAQSGAKLIVTVDNGVTAIDPICRANELGVDVVITDHHLAGDTLPDSAAMVNPNCGEPYEFGRLCGAGVAFKVAHGLLKGADVSTEDSRAFLFRQLDLAALGTIADVVPLEGENRIFASHGMRRIVESDRPGLQALIEVARLGGRSPNTDFVGFGLGPRLNAAGRTGDADAALDLLLCEDPSEARELAEKLEHLNQHRRTLENQILKSCENAAEESIAAGHEHLLVVAGQDWHLGVVGIVASRLVDRFGLPSIVLSVDNETARGSARSIPGFDIRAALQACDERLITYGGHSAAAGLSISSTHLDEFRGAINSHASPLMADLDRTAIITVDADVEGSEIDWNLHRNLERLEPFGEGNPKPSLRLRGARPVGEHRVLKERHLKGAISTGGKTFNYIGFGLAHLKSVFDGGPVDLLFRTSENHFRGKTTLEFELIDAKPAS